MLEAIVSNSKFLFGMQVCSNLIKVRLILEHLKNALTFHINICPHKK